MEAASPQPLNLHDELLRDFHDTVRIERKRENTGFRMRARGLEIVDQAQSTTDEREKEKSKA